jgi:hypothetical protein
MSAYCTTNLAISLAFERGIQYAPLITIPLIPLYALWSESRSVGRCLACRVRSE